jgi:hypothetical protein
MGPDHPQERDSHCHRRVESPSPRDPSPKGRGANFTSDYHVFSHPSPEGRGAGGEDKFLLRGTDHGLATKDCHPSNPSSECQFLDTS